MEDVVASEDGLTSQDPAGEPAFDAQAERAALARIIFAFREYLNEARWELSRWQLNYSKLSARHKALLPTQPAKFAAALHCMQTNDFFIKSMLATMEANDDDPLMDILQDADAAVAQVAGQQKRCSPGDTEKVRYVLKILTRDWSAECAAERDQSYGRILRELRSRYAAWPAEARPPRVLVPGAGVARLCVEIAGAGYEAQGNEFSYFMLVTASFILNTVSEAGQYTIHPWVHSNCNHLTDGDQLRAVRIPDRPPHEILTRSGALSMVAGDFVEVYSQPNMRGTFDSVVSCFFIDTAHNVIEYLEVIHNALKVGGLWINIGPLLYHWAESSLASLDDGELSVELSMADILRIARLFGFQLQKQEIVDAAYIANPRSMHKTVYQAAFWTMAKTTETLPDDVVLQTLVAQDIREQQQRRRQQQQQQQQEKQQQ